MSDCDPEFSENRQSKQEEIQIEYTVKGALSKYTTFAGFVIAQRYAGEKIEPGARVVKASWKPKEELILGTICSVEKSISVDVEWDNTAGVHTFPRQQLRLVDNIKPEKIELLSRVITKSEEKKTGTIRGLQKSKRVHIRWDNTQNVHTWPIFELRLFDNAQAGVKHTAVTCDECYDYPLRGIRWKCLSCDEYDLCTKCYMNDKHDVRHAFRRVETEDSKGIEMPPRYTMQFTHHAYAIGIIKTVEGTIHAKEEKDNLMPSFHDSKELKLKVAATRVSPSITYVRTKTFKLIPAEIKEARLSCFQNLVSRVIQCAPYFLCYFFIDRKILQSFLK